MKSDEQAIRGLVALWHQATAAGDVGTVLRLMEEEVVFLVCGQPPMKGRKTFDTGLREILKTHRISSNGEVQEVQVAGDLAYCWSVLRVAITPLAGGAPVTRTGSTLSVLRKQPNGDWLMWRDANLLAVSK